MADQVTKSIIVKAGPEMVYSLWANFENFPKFMKNIEVAELFSNPAAKLEEALRNFKAFAERQSKQQPSTLNE